MCFQYEHKGDIQIFLSTMKMSTTRAQFWESVFENRTQEGDRMEESTHQEL